MPITNLEAVRRYQARKRGEHVEAIPAPRTLRIEPGETFGRFTVAHEIPLPPGQRRVAECLCECGTTKRVRVDFLVSGHAKSCGCLAREQAAMLKRSHGLYGHPLYHTWLGMIHRCEDPANRSYSRYGGRGIRVCEAWHDPAAFIAWIETHLGPRPEGMTLDRADNDGNYEPGNVQWATRSQQQRNKGPSRRFAGGQS